MSPATLDRMASQIARAGSASVRIEYGPWQGSRRSQSADQIGREFIVDPTSAVLSKNYHYQPRQGYWKRRKGQAQAFDTFGSAVGQLPAKWTGRCRQLDEFKSDSFTDGIPSVAALVTKETLTGTDNGRFSNFYVRDQVNSVNYTVGADFHTTNTYPAPGTVQKYKFAPLWYDSGDGGITRGINEFERRYFFSGSRSYQTVGKWTYFPSLSGTPSRWRGTFTPTAALSQVKYGASDQSGGSAPPWGTTPYFSKIDDDTSTSASDSDFITHTVGSGAEGNVLDIRTSGLITDPGVDTGFTFKVRVKPSSAGSVTNRRMIFGMSNVAGGSIFTAQMGLDANTATPVANWVKTSSGATVTVATSGAFDEYTYSLSGAECTAVNFASAWDITFAYSGSTTGGAVGNTCDISAVQFQVGSTTTSEATRLFPSGPIPPTHCGYLTKGTPVAGTSTGYESPDADVSTGGWTQNDGVTTTNLYTFINELDTTADPITDDYIRAFGASTSTYIGTLSDFGFTPVAGDTVKIRWRAARPVPGASIDLAVDLIDSQGSPVNYIGVTESVTAGFSNHSYTLSDAHIAAITAGVGGWNSLRVRLIASGGNASDQMLVSFYKLEYTPGASREGGWHGKDRFPFALAYRFEDDAVWAYATPRLPNGTLTDGLGIFTVDASNAETGYDKITWTLPTPPYGVKKVLLLRGIKIDSTSDDNLAMNIHDMRIVAEVDAGVTSYDDYNADDDALYLDVDKFFIHEDHIMPPRARWNFAGDSRMCHSYGGLNPAAITLAPVGFATNFDLTGSDTATTPYAANASYYQIVNDGVAANSYLRLIRDTGSVASRKDFSFTTYTTLQALMDAVNHTIVSDTWTAQSGGSTAGAQWRGQILPGVNPEASTLNLCPTIRTASTTTTSSSTAITFASAAVAATIPVGSFVTGTGITDGTYLISKPTSTTGTLSANATGSGTNTLSYMAGTGDSITGATHSQYEGYTRVIANSLPGFLFFTKTYLDTFPVEKSSIWMTTASPLSTKSAANNFVGRGANKHTPPSTAGISMGGAGVDNGFFTPFSQKRAVIRNLRDAGTGVDSDYRLLITNESSGSAGPVVAGNRCAFTFSPEGWVGADLSGEMLISGDIYQHARSDAVTAVGDFSYEAPLCIAAAAVDTDTAYMYAKVMRNALWVSYRTSASTTHPDRVVCYDFSESKRSGVQALVRDTPVYGDNGVVKIPAGVLWGWSTPGSSTTTTVGRSFTCMTEGRRADGSHLYAWNDLNAGSTGDGRIDEFETGETDNGTAISAALYTPWESVGSSDNIQGRELVFEHSSPSGATVAGVFNRSFTGDSYTCTPDLSSTLIVSVYRWLLTLPARVHSAACYCGFTQTAGTAGEVRRIELQAAKVKDIKPGTAG